MKLFERIRPQKTEKRSAFEVTGVGCALQYNGYGTYKTGQAMTLAAVHRCVSVICNSVASLPPKLYAIDEHGYKLELENDLSYCLAKRPNKKMNAYTFYYLIVRDILMQGNAYALIRRVNGKIVGFDYISAGLVSPIDCIDHVEYVVTGVKGRVRSEDILHFMNYTDDGVIGISVLTHARRTLGIADYGDKAAENFYKSGGCTSGFLKFEGPSSQKQREEMISAWNAATAGPNNGPNGIAVLPANVTYTQLSVNPADAQLLESRKFEVIDICRFFGVSPTKCFDMSSASYSTVEATELAFLNDTLRPLLSKIEMELETKLFSPGEHYDIKFDVSELLRTDKTSQAQYFTQLFNLGVLSPNDIRKQLDMDAVEGGDIHVAQINLTSIKNLETINATESDNRLQEEGINNNNDNDNDTKNQ